MCHQNIFVLKSMSMCHIRIASILCLGLSIVLGCNSAPENPATYPVTGKVTYQNQPVEGATVVLVAQSTDGRGAVGNTDAEGNFKVGTFGEGDGALPGSYKIKVFKYEMIAEAPKDDDDVMTAEEEQAAYTGVEDIEEGGNLLPLKYEDPNTSGFSVDVVSDPVIVDLVLD
jgi:hypothetical protein